MIKKPAPHQMEMFPTAQAAKAEALERVAENSGDWWPRAFAQALRVIESHRGERKTGEQLRFLIAPKAGDPHHHNTWGSLIRCLRIQGVLTPTGDRVPMEGPKSNARDTEVYLLTPHSH